MIYAEALEQRSKVDAIEAYRNAFAGQTRIRYSLDGEPAMFRYQVYALRRLLLLKPEVFPELLQYAVSEECPGALRRAMLCLYAADHDQIGQDFVTEIPTKVPRDRFDQSMYVEGMLDGFETVRTAKQSVNIKSAWSNNLPRRNRARNSTVPKPPAWRILFRRRALRMSRWG